MSRSRPSLASASVMFIGKGGLYGHSLRMAPPMNLTEAEAKEGLVLLTDALRAVDAGVSR